MLGRTDLEASTCWDFPTQSDGHLKAGDAAFNGVTPARCAENLVRRYARPGDLVVDPMAGSGTIGDVARSLGRRAISFDLTPKRSDILRADARAWPIPDGMAALAVIDSPYSDNLAYGRDRDASDGSHVAIPDSTMKCDGSRWKLFVSYSREASSGGSLPTSTAEDSTLRRGSGC